MEPAEEYYQLKAGNDRWALRRTGRVRGRFSTCRAEKAQAFAWLEKGCEPRDNWLKFICVDAILGPLRSDPRFQDVLRRLNFSQ